MSAIKQLNRLAATAKTSVLKPATKQILLPTAGQQAAIRMMGQTRAASTEGGATNVSIVFSRHERCDGTRESRTFAGR